MSSGGQAKSNEATQTKLFAPSSLSVEQIVLNSINSILLFISANNVGDLEKAVEEYIYRVRNLDSFVYPLLTADKTKDWEDYKRKRAGLCGPGKWRGTPEQASQLFELTVEVIQVQRLFKLERQTYFGMRWKKTQVFDMPKLMEIDEEMEVEE